MLKMTSSVEKGIANLKHNFDTDYRHTLSHTNSEKSLIIENKPVRDVYHLLFDDALKNYNQKQTRTDRKITNYYEYITDNCMKTVQKAKSNNSKTCNAIRPFSEIIVTCGNCIDNQNDRDLQIKMLNEIYEKLKINFPQLYFFAATIHLDEATPHLHADFVPYATKQTRGLETKVSFEKALEQMGIKREKALVNNSFIGDDGHVHEKQPTLFNGFRNKIDTIIENVYHNNNVQLVRANTDEALNIKNINEYKEKKSVQLKAIKELIEKPTDEIFENVTKKIIQDIPATEISQIKEQQKNKYKKELEKDDEFYQQCRQDIKATITESNKKLSKVKQEVEDNLKINEQILKQKELIQNDDIKKIENFNQELIRENFSLKKYINSLNDIIDKLKCCILKIFLRTTAIVHNVIFDVLEDEKYLSDTKAEYDTINELEKDFKEVENEEEM